MKFFEEFLLFLNYCNDANYPIGDVTSEIAEKVDKGFTRLVLLIPFEVHSVVLRGRTP
jgi:hypothetical protein